jgi:hypothetical protein
MLTSIPIGSFKTACAAARAAHEAEIASDKAKLAERSFVQLRDGAIHNGLLPTDKQLQEMREMSARDVDHIAEDHPSIHYIKHIGVMLAMADYADEEVEVIIDHLEFQLLKDFLPNKG